MNKSSVPDRVIRRLPRYLKKLDDLICKGDERISSNELGRQLGLTPSQIRRDFNHFGEFGWQGYGYNVKFLRRHLAHILGLDKRFSIILVGTGKIGQSLLENFDFNQYGFRFLGAFEICEELVGTTIAGYTIMDAKLQDQFIRDNHVDIAILSIKSSSAQRVADELIASGVKSIWNFTEAEIDPGDSGVTVENIHFSDSLLVLSYFLSEKEN